MKGKFVVLVAIFLVSFVGCGSEPTSTYETLENGKAFAVRTEAFVDTLNSLFGSTYGVEAEHMDGMSKIELGDSYHFYLLTESSKDGGSDYISEIILPNRGEIAFEDVVRTLIDLFTPDQQKSVVNQLKPFSDNQSDDVAEMDILNVQYAYGVQTMYIRPNS